MKYAIHKSLNISARDINDSINDCREIDGVEVSIYKDGWIIAEPSNLEVKEWQRNREDYHIETIGEEQQIYQHIELEK